MCRVVTSDVESRSLVVEITQLPPVTSSLGGPFYQAVLLVSDEPIRAQPRTTWLTSFVLGTAFAHGEVERVELGRIGPDLVGNAMMRVTSIRAPLGNVEGAVIELVVPQAATATPSPSIYRVLEGEVGNLENADGTAGAGPALPSTGGGHH